MTAKKTFYILLGCLALSIVAVGGAMYFGFGLMKSSSNSLVNTKLDNLFTEEKERTYIKASKDLEKYKGLSDTLNKILPKDKDQARAVRELYKIGDESGVAIVRVEFPASTLGAKAAAPSTTATSSSAAQTAVSQAQPVSGLPGVQGIDLELNVEGKNDGFTNFSNMITFLQKVELNRRSMQIKKINVQTDDQSRKVKFDVTVTIFVKP